MRCVAFVLLLLASVSMTACGKEDGGGSGTPAVRWDPEVTVKPDLSGAAVLLLSGNAGTKWSAEVVSGSWVSLDRSGGSLQSTTGEIGTSWQSREIPVYYTANTTREERRAQVQFAYEGKAPVVLDLVQYSLTGGEDVYELGKDKIWPEIPAYKAGSTLKYVTHTAQLGGYNARNFTLCFDSSKLGAWWVAYPLHGAHIGSGRPEKDPWAYDPKISSTVQANLGAGSYTGNYDRGHQLPNADRNGNTEMQYQTFYCSNATPQNSTLNQQPWARLEGRVRNWVCSDTLYVVTGAYWAPNSSASTTDKSGKLCPLPTSYYKVLVRTRQGNIRQKGDKLSSYDASQLQAIGFWVNNASGQGEAKDWVKSVKEIEQLTGFTFFPTVPEQVKQTVTGAWGL